MKKLTLLLLILTTTTSGSFGNPTPLPEPIPMCAFLEPEGFITYRHCDVLFKGDFE